MRTGPCIWLEGFLPARQADKKSHLMGLLHPSTRRETDPGSLDRCTAHMAPNFLSIIILCATISSAWPVAALEERLPQSENVLLESLTSTIPSTTASESEPYLHSEGEALGVARCVARLRKMCG